MPVDASKQDLLIGITGAGAMGRYLGRWLTDAGYRIRVLDREDWDAVQTLCAGIELALLSVPIASAPEVIQRLAPYLPDKDTVPVYLRADEDKEDEAKMAAFTAEMNAVKDEVHALTAKFPLY